MDMVTRLAALRAWALALVLVSTTAVPIAPSIAAPNAGDHSLEKPPQGSRSHRLGCML